MSKVWAVYVFYNGKQLPQKTIEASKWSNAKHVVINNIYYYSAKEAARCLTSRESYAKILRKINNPNTNYYWFSDFMKLE